MDGDRVGGDGRLPAGGTEAEGEVEILRVDEDSLVETAGGLPGRTTVRRRSARRARDDRASEPRLPHRTAVEPREPRQGRVRRQADTVDLVRSGTHELAPATIPTRSSANGDTRRSRKSAGHSTSLLSSTTTSPSPAATPRLQAAGNPRFRSSSTTPNLRKLRANALRGAVGRRVVGDHHDVGQGLLTQTAEATPGQIPPVERRDDDVDRGGHPRRSSHTRS